MGRQFSACELSDIFVSQPIIAAVKDQKELERALCSDVKAVFVLFGDILTIASIVSRISDCGKHAFVHVDLIEGLSSREIAVDFIAASTVASGIISTKAALVHRAKAHGLIAIQRFFLLDSLAIRNIERQIQQKDSADFIEVLPGLMPKIIRSLSLSLNKPVIAGGLISDKEDVVAALGAGALAVSSTNEAVWHL